MGRYRRFRSGRIAEARPNDLAHLGEDPVFHFQPHLRLLDLAYPVDELLFAIREEEDQQENDIASNVIMERAPKSPDTKLRLPKRQKVYLAVHRQEGETVYFKRLEPEAFALLRALHQGKNSFASD